MEMLEKGKRPTVISLFTGAMGLDLGFELEGFEIKVFLDKDPVVVENLKVNRPGMPVISWDICCVPTSEILERAGLKVGEPTVVTG